GYYAWGETSTKSNYGTENYSVQGKYSMGQDNLTELLPADDAAHIVMGGNWYIPTREEVQELLDNCTFESIEMKNGSGYKVVSKRNGKYFLLPAAGSKTYDVEEYVGGVFFYWTSSVNADRASEAWNLNTYNNELVVDGRVRFRGCPVRAVTGRPVVSVESVSLDKTQASLYPDGRLTLTATVLPANAADISVVWTSSNPSVAEVDQSGNVTAKSVGAATITVTTNDGGKKATCEVTVVERTPDVIPVESVMLDRSSLSLRVGSSEHLTATVLPASATDKSITWASTNPAIAEVDQQGNVTAKSVGTVTITATTTDGGKVVGCEVTVAPGSVAIQSVAIEPSSISMKVGETALFSIIVTPSNADVFSTRLIISGDSGVLKWGDTDGTQRSIVALSQGSAAVTVTLTGAGGEQLSATCNVTVIYDSSYIPVDYLVFEEPSIEMIVGDTRPLSVTIFPDDATNQTVTWSSSNNNVVTVNENGMLTAVGAGSASITALADGKSNSINVTVSDGTVPVESIRLDHYDIAVGKGESLKLTATVLPDNASDKTVSWSSTDTGVARVDAFGTVTGVDAGEAFIVAKAGDKNVSCRVSVIAFPERIDLNATELTMTKGEKFTLVGTVYPPNANDRNVYYYADNSNVVMVGERTGEVYANKIGTGVVTAKNKSSGITATCTVTVVAAGPPGIILEQDSFTVDAAQSGNIRIPLQLVNTDGSSLQASSDASWLGTRVVGNGVTFYVAENRSTLSRTATITITYSTATATVTVKQKGKTPTGPPDIVFDDQFDPNANNGVHYSGEYDNVFYARVENPVEGVELQMTADVPWITNLRPTSNENWYCFTPTMNTTGRERTG
ncbi:MAG: Ig-like domain-containing protein, partial [Bacteroidales bacterium]|nr:Ig-like domain-containing protein [Bacteroidales bacterium]